MRHWAGAVVVGLATFACGFLVARAAGVDGGDGAAPRAASVEQVPTKLVTINNLERAPSIKPLRSAAGLPPPSTTATTGGVP